MSKKRDDLIAKAKLLRAAGASYSEIGRAIGVDGGTAHCWMDPVFARATMDRKNRIRRSQEPTRALPVHFVSRNSSPTSSEILDRLREVPEDTRSLTGRLMGDPLPGRSALARLS